MLNGVRELVAEKAERLTPRSGDIILGVAVRGFCMDQIGIDQSMFKMVSLYMVNGSAMCFLVSIIFALPEIALYKLPVYRV